VTEYNIAVKKDGKFYVGYCLEIPQARGQGNTKAEAIKDTKRAIRLCKAYIESKKKTKTGLVTVSVWAYRLLAGSKLSRLWRKKGFTLLGSLAAT
jgi:predicted RNase H-like HicB family nuclease